MGTNVPKDLKYTKDHEWAKSDGKIATIGITAFAVEQLGDVVFVDLPKVGDKVQAGATFGVVESTKAVSDLFCPLTGTIVAVNSPIADAPETLNSDPYGAWLVQIEYASAGDFDGLMDAEQYEQHLQTAGH